MISLGAALSLFALGVSGFLAVYVLGVNPRGHAHRAFFILMMSFVLWDACEAIARAMPPNAPAADVYPFIQGVWIGISLVPAALVHIALTYPEETRWLRRPAAFGLVYGPVVGWAYLIFGTNLLIAGVSDSPLGPGARVGSDYLLLSLLYGAWFYVAVALFVGGWWRVRKGHMRRMQGIVVAGLLLGTIPAGITEIFWPFLHGGDTPMGLASSYTLIWSIFIAYAIARYRYLVIEPVTESRAAQRPRLALRAGLNYLVVEPGRSAGMGAFREIVSTTPGLCVTGLSPALVAQRFGLERTPVLWITSASSEGRTVRPQALDFELVHTILKFLRENPGTAVLLDDLDYLASVNGFDAVARVLKRVANQASAVGGTLIVTVGRDTFTPDQMALLGGCVDRVLEIRETAKDDAPRGRHHELFLMTVQDAPLAMPLVSQTGGLLLTTDHPAKARRRFGEHFEVLWITDHPEAGTSSVRPTALDTEAKRALANYVHAHPGSDLVLVGLEQVALLSDFKALHAFVKETIDVAGLRGCRLVATLSPNALSPQETAMLARRFDVPAPQAPVKGSPFGGPSTAAPGSRILSRGPVS